MTRPSVRLVAKDRGQQKTQCKDSVLHDVRGKENDYFGAGQVLRSGEETKELPRRWEFLVPGVGSPNRYDTVGVKGRGLEVKVHAGEEAGWEGKVWRDLGQAGLDYGAYDW